MTRLQAQKLALDLMLEYGLIHNGWTFRIDKGGVHRYGSCSWTRKEITLGLAFVTNPGAPAEAIRDTILHEIAHALCPPGSGHSQIWRDKCLDVGAHPERTKDLSYWRHITGMPNPTQQEMDRHILKYGKANSPRKRAASYRNQSR